MSKHFLYQTTVVICVLLVLIACNAAPTDTPAIPLPTTIPDTLTPTLVPPSPSITIPPSATAIPTPTPQPSPTSIPGSLIYAEKGVYNVGFRIANWYDPVRDDRLIEAGVYYPGDTTKSLDQDAKPDSIHGPYPLVIFSATTFGTPKWHSNLTTHLASHGFVVICLSEIGNTYQGLLTDRPLDVKYVIDNLDSLFDTEMLSVINREHIGLIGYSNGSYVSLNAAGAQVDPIYWQEEGLPLSSSSLGFIGLPSDNSDESSWEEIMDYRSQYGELTDDDLWPAIATIDVDAIIGIIPADLQYFGDRGLVALEVPTMFLTSDQVDPFHFAVEPFFSSIGTDEKELVTIHGCDVFTDCGSTIGLAQFGDAKAVTYFKHFITAFLGYYLKGNTSDLAYFNKEFVDLHLDYLHWGDNK